MLIIIDDSAYSGQEAIITTEDYENLQKANRKIWGLAFFIRNLKIG